MIMIIFIGKYLERAIFSAFLNVISQTFYLCADDSYENENIFQGLLRIFHITYWFKTIYKHNFMNFPLVLDKG